ncbi:MAG: diadenylate cyclase CdaA, partial [Elainellaceae cyanobacterium]
QWLANLGWTQALLIPVLDVGLVLVLAYMVLVVIGERRTLWMVRGLIVMMLAAALSNAAGFTLLSFVLEKLVIGSAVAMAFIFQAEFRRLLEQLGRGELLQLFRPARETTSKPDDVIDEIVDAVKNLSQNRIGALLILETDRPIDERDFSVPGVRLNADVSGELIQTIFQTSTLLHDGAVLIRDSRVVAASVILPISERDASRQLGTRHRAAMGITERVEHCLCIVVSEETGSISVAERGALERPLTSNRLREILRERFTQSTEREVVSPRLRNFGRWLGNQIRRSVSRVIRLFFHSNGRNKRKSKRG